MSNYYVSGCVADGDDVSICDDSVAQFWTLYHRNEEGLSEGIIDCMFREDAESAMRVYKERDALAAAHSELRESMAAIHNTIRLDGVNTSLGALLSASKRAHEASLPTDAYLNAVRAEGALLVAERMRKARYVFKDMHHGVVSECADIAVDVAKKLRAGEPS